MNPINTNNNADWKYDSLSYEYAEKEYRMLKLKLIQDRMKLPMTLSEQRLYQQELENAIHYVEGWTNDYNERTARKRHQVKFQYTLFELNQQDRAEAFELFSHLKTMPTEIIRLVKDFSLEVQQVEHQFKMDYWMRRATITNGEWLSLECKDKRQLRKVFENRINVRPGWCIFKYINCEHYTGADLHYELSQKFRSSTDMCVGTYDKKKRKPMMEINHIIGITIQAEHLLKYIKTSLAKKKPSKKISK